MIKHMKKPHITEVTNDAKYKKKRNPRNLKREEEAQHNENRHTHERLAPHEGKWVLLKAMNEHRVQNIDQ